MEMDSVDDRMNHMLIPFEAQQIEFDTQKIEFDTQQSDSEMQLDILEPQLHDTEPPLDNSEAQPAKRRKKKSEVWEHFTIKNVREGCRKAFCNQCNREYAYSVGSKVSGTSHLKRHIAKGACPVVLKNQENSQLTPCSAPSSKSEHSGTQRRRFFRAASAPHISFDADMCHHEIAQMIIMHDYPLHLVEHPGFLAFVQNLQPQFDMVSFNALEGDCVATYLREKQTIQKFIENTPGRICLTLDLWSSTRTIGYIFITAQFIDSDWNIHRKLLNVVMEPYPDSDAAFSHSVAVCLSDWGMDGKLFSVTINQPLSNAAFDNIRALLSVKNPWMLNGQLLVGNCIARALSNMVQTALTVAHGAVKKVRDSVKYVKTSESREEKFLELKRQLQVPSSKTLSIDDGTKWNTTYEMLTAACELKLVFSCLDTSDPDYKNSPSAEDWKQIEILRTYLTPLIETANILGTIQTTNTFFHEAWKIQLELGRGVSSEDPFVSTLAKSMREEFDKYWKSCCFILAIAVVMDPRFKMKLVEFSFTKIYDEEAASYVKIVDEGIHELFLEYVALPLPLTPAFAEEANGMTVEAEDHEGLGILDNGLGLTDFDVYIMETTSQLSRSELDQYLEESLLPRVHEFDVMGWWKVNRMKYPTLSKMARDILSIQVCSVPAASVFDTLRKEMDSYRCELRPETVEALMCAKDWLLQSEKAETPVTDVKIEVPI